MLPIRPLARALLALALLLATLIPLGPVPLPAVPVAAAPPASPLSLTDRVACQTALEEVSWQHRTWPSENPDPKPALAAVLPPAQIQARVEDNLRQSAALERLWSQPLTGEQLQAELDRMAAGSQQPEVLAELFAALGDDPHQAAECLARPALADRLLRSWFADDERWQGAIRAQARAALTGQPTVAQLPTLGGEYSVVEWVRQEDAAREPISPAAEGEPVRIGLSPEEWQELVGRLARALAPPPSVADPTATPPALPAPTVTDASALPVGVVGTLQEDTDKLYAQGVLARGPDRLTVATVSWAKAPFDAWWAQTAPSLPAMVAEPGESYVLPALAGACTDDTWPASPGLSSVVPDARYLHTAVWTGSEMIVWGGYDGAVLKTGGRYSPATDTWSATSLTGAPSERVNHTAVWTGSTMIVWGGNGATFFDTGGRYTPSSDSWTPTTTSGAPTARTYHTAVWTGSTMIVWGGFGSGVLNTGGVYAPGSDSWSPTAITGAPTGRYLHTAVGAGSQMIVWGGFSGSYLNTGGRYTPATDTWVPTTAAGAPAGRYYHTAVWTGSQMLVWGGFSGGNLNTGGRYTPGSDSWSPTTTSGAPGGRYLHTAVWTGSQMLVWGGFSGGNLNTGGRYTPGSDSWGPVTISGAPSARYAHSAVWTGSQMIVWGGYSGDYLNTGGRYSPGSDSWSPTATTGAPAGRYLHTAVWTGSEMIVWGGHNGAFLSTGGRYTPATDTWVPTTTTGAPGARAYHTAIWTGSQMLVWGGLNLSGYLNSGGRYTPGSDSWTVPTTTGAPAARYLHTAVWTGSQMIVWGGVGGGFLNTGGRYTPNSDTWTATTTSGAPSARYFHTAVWTGTQMLVWGGVGSSYFNTGGRYTPATDSWSPTATSGAPGARVYHTAVWSGSQMLVWGGVGADGSTIFNTGARYTPATDTWVSTAATGAPSARYFHTAVWTGTQMLVWGGVGSSYFNTGGRYSPAADTWSAATTSGAPSGRHLHTAVWTGTRMLVWSGINISGYLATGGAYCALGNTAWFFAEGYTGAGFDEYLTLQNPGSLPAQVAVTYMLAGFSPLTKTYTVPPTSRSTLKINDEVGPNQAVSLQVLSDRFIVAERPMYFSYGPGGWTGGHDVVGAVSPATTWYFAEGYTGPGFDEYLTLQNPNASSANVTLTYYLASGGPVTRSLSVPATSRTTVAVHETAQGVGRNQAVSTKVSSDRPIVAERPMYFSYGPAGWTGGHVVVGATAPNTTWYFAEGYTGTGFDEYLTLQNPNGSPADVVLTYFLAGGGPVTRLLQVPATARATVAVHDPAQGVGRNQAVSVKVSSSLPIVAERPMYFSYGPGGWTGGHDVVGATAPASRWYFAEGYTGAGFDEYLTLQNPNGSAATVTVTYLRGSGGPIVKSYPVAGNQRATLKVNDEVGPNQAVSMQVESSLPIVAERPMYFSYGPGGWTGGHDVLGYAP